MRSLITICIISSAVISCSKWPDLLLTKKLMNLWRLILLLPLPIAWVLGNSFTWHHQKLFSCRLFQMTWSIIKKTKNFGCLVLLLPLLLPTFAIACFCLLFLPVAFFPSACIDPRVSVPGYLTALLDLEDFQGWLRLPVPLLRLLPPSHSYFPSGCIDAINS